MTWIPDVVMNETIESAWGNLIRDRTVTGFADAAERDAAIPTPAVGQACFLESTGGFYVHDGGVWRGLPRGLIGIQTFGEVNLSTPGNFVTKDIVLAETRIVRVNYSIQAIQLTAIANVTIQLTVTGQTARRIYNKAGVAVNESLDDGKAVTGGQTYVLSAGTYTCGIRAATVSAGAIRSQDGWDNFIEAYDFGSP